MNKPLFSYFKCMLFCCFANWSFAQESCMNIPDMDIQDDNGYLMAMGSGSRVEIHAADAIKRSFTKLSQTAVAGATTISLAELTGWEIGDVIAIAPTDFNWAERESRTITAISANGLVLTLDSPLDHRHNGTVEEYSSGPNEWTLDMRAEVALLSRNVKIQGNPNSDATEFGGHTMTMMGAEHHISGVEYFRMGQANRLGKYPIHWHTLRDGGQGQYIRNSSVHGGFNKGITIHDTNLTYLENNVIYNNIGHGFFFEDATETGNVLQGNIAFGQRKAPNLAGATIPSDFTRPASYWVTNPNNHFIDNVAAGSEGTGIWITAEPAPMGAALATGDYEGYVPKDQPVGLINGFTSHSNVRRNFSMGWRLREESDGGEQAGEFIDRYNDEGALFDYTIENLTLYKGAGDGQLWIRGFGGRFNNVIMADARNQMMLRGQNALTNSLVIADTDTNEPTNAIRDGLQLYDGGITFENIHFVNYNGAQDDAFFQRRGVDVGPTHSVRGLTFSNGSESNRYSDRDAADRGIDARDHNGNVILDIDGSLFGTPMALITPQLDDTGLAIQINVPGWNAHPGATLFNNEAWINPPGSVIGVTHLKGANNPTLTRSDGPSITGADRMNETLVIADTAIYYNIFPGGGGYEDEVSLAVTAINRGSEVLYRFTNMPSTATIEGAAKVDSKLAMDNAALSTYWFDGNAGVMWVKLVGVDPYQVPSLAPAELTRRWGNEVLIHSNGGLQSSDVSFTGAHNLYPEFPGTPEVPAFFSGGSKTIEMTEAMSRWSNASTWDTATPDENSVVVIGPGKTVVLDQSVIIHGIIINGGELLIEDEANLEIELVSDFILIIGGGLFQAGTEDNPIDTDFTLTLNGTNPNFDLRVSENEVFAGQENTVFATCNILVEGVQVTPPVSILEPGETQQLTATVSPTNATDTSVTWSSSNTDIATVNVNGLVTALASGETTITTTTVDGGFTAAATIIVDAQNTSGENLALQKATIQSSTGVGGVSSRAVDNNTDGKWTNGSVTHTLKGGSAQPWWRVDLGATYVIGDINVFNRTDARCKGVSSCPDRLEGAKVYVGNVNSNDPNDYEEVATLTDAIEQNLSGLSVTGRYVMVRHEGSSKILSLAEVQVYGSLAQVQNSVVQAVEMETSIHIYPNPVAEVVTVTVNTPSEMLGYQIMGLDGRVYLQGNEKLEYSADTLELNMEGLPSGIYVLQVSDGQITSETKIIKQ